LREICEKSGITGKQVKKLIDSARRGGASPWEWRGTFEIVRVDQFRSIEIYDGTNWKPHSAEEAMQISLEINERFEVNGDWVRPKVAK
jgi:hypothetical protein